MLRHAGCHPPLNGFSPVFSKRTEPESLLSSAFFPHLFWQILVTGSFYGHEIYCHKRYVVKSVEQKKKGKMFDNNIFKTSSSDKSEISVKSQMTAEMAFVLNDVRSPQQRHFP